MSPGVRERRPVTLDRVSLRAALLAAALLLPGLVAAHGPGSHVVGMDEAGFAPATLEVLEGDTVVFENRGRGPRWPASQIHPTHQIYPEFDPGRAIAAGEAWRFAFAKAGVWKFHDHLNPELAGTIVVKPRDEARRWPALAPVATARALARRAREELIVGAGRLYYALSPGELEGIVRRLNVRNLVTRDEELRYWVRLLGPETVMARLLEDSRGGSVFDCHQEAHQIGRVAYELYGAASFQRGGASCHSGYYHGAMEAFLREKGTVDPAAHVDELCRGFATRFGLFQCYHGAGHGVMAYEGYDLPKALQTCARLQTPYARGACQEGAFMENVVAALGWGALPGHRTAWVSQDPHFPCNRLGEDAGLRFHCYQMQTSWMLALFRLDFDRVAQECLRAPADTVPVCFRSFGRDAAGQTRRDPAEITRLCGRVPRVGDAHEQCIAGAVNVIVDFWGGRLQGQASELCRLVTGSTKQACYEAVVSRLPDLFPDARRQREVCLTFEPAYRGLCRGLG